MAQEGKWDIVVAGDVNMDYLAKGARLPEPGETVTGELFQQAPGGKGGNQAVAAARLGARVALLSRAGSDQRGSEIVQRLDDEGVDTQRIRRDAAAATGIALIQVGEKGEKQILTAPGANLNVSVADMQASSSLLQNTRVVLVQLAIPLEAVREAITIGHAAGAKIVLDPAPAQPLPDDLLAMVDVIKPNATEAGIITGVKVRNRTSAHRAAEWFLQRGVGAVAIQAGKEGNLLIWRDVWCWLPIVPVGSVDATGAGDAFAAAIAVMLAEGKSLEDAGPFANAAAALTTTKLGAQAALPTRSQVESLLPKAKELAQCKVES